MASLYWHSEVRFLSEALAHIGELKHVASVELGRIGFTNIQHNELEVAGGKGACWLSIAHFHIADRRFWEVVMASGDDFNQTKAAVDEAVAMLRGLRFL